MVTSVSGYQTTMFANIVQVMKFWIFMGGNAVWGTAIDISKSEFQVFAENLFGKLSGLVLPKWQIAR